MSTLKNLALTITQKRNIASVNNFITSYESVNLTALSGKSKTELEKVYNDAKQFLVTNQNEKSTSKRIVKYDSDLWISCAIASGLLNDVNNSLKQGQQNSTNPQSDNENQNDLFLLAKLQTWLSTQGSTQGDALEGSMILRDAVKNKSLYSDNMKGLINTFDETVGGVSATGVVNGSNYTKVLQRLTDVMGKALDEKTDGTLQSKVDDRVGAASRKTAEDLMELFNNGRMDLTKYGDNAEMSDEDWREYIRFLKMLDDQGRLKYGTEYTNADGTHTSLKIVGNNLYIDCWGLLKVGSLLYLNPNAMSGLSFRTVNDMYNYRKPH
jgi:hypothetical protein